MGRGWAPRWGRVAVAASSVFVGAGCGLALWVVSAPHPAPLLAASPSKAVLVMDRAGDLLRFHPAPGGVRAIPVGVGETPPYLVEAVLAAEDGRFFHHPGVDPLAVVRAAWQNLTTGRVVSGASTVTMQLARLLQPRPRAWAAKLAQVRLALRLELALSKEEILAAYLSRVPMGHQVVGFAAASWLYLGKPLPRLSPAEAALLAAIPRAPSRLNPWKDLPALRARRDAVLARMRARGALDEPSYRAALEEPVVLADRPRRWEAPHLVKRALAEAPPAAKGGRLVTTLHRPLQQRVERIVERALGELAEHGVKHMAVAVLDVPRGEWLALEGSGGFAQLHGGQLDGTRTPRQPGSALKPFTYAVAFDAGWGPADLLADLPAAFPWREGTWTPRNYDGRFRGPLRAREALACSVNIPAARLLARLGPGALLAVLQRAGLSTLSEPAEKYGLGLTLGAGEVRLDELTNAYAALLRGGVWRPAHSWRRVEDANGRVLARSAVGQARQLFTPEAAAQVVDILADPQARAAAFGEWSVLRLPFAAAVKTGTSEGFRDNWCVGGTAEVVVGVWCGDFQRVPMGNLSGVTGAGGVWREVMLVWAELFHPREDLRDAPTLLAPPPTLVRRRVCALSGLAPTQACPVTVEELLRRKAASLPPCHWHRRTADGRGVVHWPARYRAWAAELGLTKGEPGGGQAPSVARREEDSSLQVLSPAHGDAYVVSPELPRTYQTLELRCAVPARVTEVTWLVNGVPLARAASPFTVSWVVQPGEHRFQVQAGQLRSKPVVITVYGR